MTLQTWLLYFAAVCVLVATPGPAVLMSMSNAVRFGVRRALVSALGSITAVCIVMTVCAIGLGAALATSEKIFSAIKWFGVIYLVWLGFKMFRSRESGFGDGADGADGATMPPPAKSFTGLYLQGFLVGASNPKALLFFTAFFPQFLNPAQAQLPQFLILGTTFICCELFGLMTYASFAARIAPWLRAPGRARRFNQVTGAAFVGAGALLATVHRS
ncbi:putative homoserine/homoserine lactone efflux protein [Oxalobacteraceae bacterium IMCC9480]|nr:putative homoserine/homoserine lactone efflux protein [Oxalobacteraceae bacterium IMCC9480]NDP60013.1 LysE family transporter [Oxalobacteraceae bacterium]